MIAQNKRGKAKPLATPPVITGAEIISQAGDYTEPVPAEKTPTKTPTTNAAKIKDLNDRLKKLETSQGSTYDDRQKRVLMNLDILTRAEQRADSLRKQLFDMIEKENNIRARLEQIEYDIRPEVIERTLQLDLIELGDPAGQHRQLPRLVTESQHAHRHRRQRVGIRERIGKLRTMADAIGGIAPDRGRAGRRHHVDQDAQRGGEIDAATEQQAKITAKQRGAVRAHHVADGRQPRDRIGDAAADALLTQ